MQVQNLPDECISSSFLTKYEIPYRVYHVEAKEQTISSTRANLVHPSLPDWFLYEYQLKVIKLKNKNVLLVSGTGSGKTEAAYFHILKNIDKGIMRQVLAVYPTNILAHQQFDRINNYAKLFGIKASFLAGETVSKAASKEAEIITTNPAFILDQMLSKKRFLQFQEDYVNLKFVLFDEIHMYNSRQMTIIAETLKNIKPDFIFFLSATVCNLQEIAQFLTSVNNRATEIIIGNAAKASTDYVIIENKSFSELLLLFNEYLSEVSITLVFTRTIRETEELYKLFFDYCLRYSSFSTLPPDKAREILNHKIVRHHSKLDVEERKRVEERIKFSSFICFSPKTLAQGIDMGSVTRIVHISLPATLAEFLQREGRSGRRKDITRTESIILVSNTYDYIICKNEIFFRRYITSSAERLLLLLDSPFNHLYSLIFKHTMDQELTEDELGYLIQLGILEDGRLTPKGKFYTSNFLSFFGSTQYIKLFNKNGTLVKERVSKSDILLQYQPHTLHFKNGHLQVVKEYIKKKLYYEPVFEIIDKKDKLYNLYSKHNLRSTVVTNIKTKSRKMFSTTIEELKIIPVQVVYSYLNEYQKKDSFETFLVDTKKFETILTLFVRLESNYQSFNAEMAIHCFMEALRITSDIRYTELRHSVTSNERECRILLYESELSGLLLYLNTEEVLATSKTVYAQYLTKLKNENKSVTEIYPIPTCQYEKKQKDVHLIYQVEDILTKLCYLIDQMKKYFIKLN